MTTASATSFETRDRPWWLVLLSGIAAVIIGFLLITSTQKTLFILVQFIGIYWIVSGIFDLVSMFIDHSAWGWKLFIGIIGILAGLSIVRHPIVSTVALPVIFTWVAGIYGLMAGIVLIIQAFKGGGWGVGIMGALALILGMLILGNTLISAAALVWASGFIFVIFGIVGVIQAFRQRS